MKYFLITENGGKEIQREEVDRDMYETILDIVKEQKEGKTTIPKTDIPLKKKASAHKSKDMAEAVPPYNPKKLGGIKMRGYNA